MWEGVGDRTELQHIDPHSYGHQGCVFLVLQGCSTGGWWGKLSAKCWFPQPHLVSGFWSPKLTDFLSLSSYIIVQSPTQYLWKDMFDRHQAEITVCSSQVTLFRCISLWLYRGILPCPILSANLAHTNGICTSTVFGMEYLAGSKVNIQH